MRKIININQDWKFVKQNQEAAHSEPYDDSEWEQVNVPHTWNAIDGANGFDFYKGACWYRKSVRIDQLSHGQKVFIEFEGANSITDVYVNGQHMGQHRGGYATFRFDITHAIRFGHANTLAVKVDNTVVEDVYPQMADFTFFGGIYRNVNLVFVQPVHFDLMDYGSQGVYIQQDKVTEEQSLITVRANVVNDGLEDQKVRIWANINDASGHVVAYAAKEVVIRVGGTEIVEMPVNLHQPTLWNGKKNPYLYQAEISITSFNDTVDQITIPIGLRYFKVDPQHGFFLNGERLALNGVSRHQDRKDMGWAITAKEQEEDMNLIKEVGATSIRLAHYQHNQYFYDLCDREGMVVWAEIPFISVMSKTDLEGVNAKQQMTELIRQNFNHPSIMFWGIQNEIQIGGDTPAIRKLVSELNELTKREDPTRLSTMANVMFVPDEDEYNHLTDIIGYNKYYGWYNGEAQDFAAWIDGFHKKNPAVSLGISEYGAEGIIQYHTNDPKVKDYSEEYHALYHETVWSIFKKRPFLWSTYVWNMFDFGANIRDEGGVKGRNNKGLVTYDRKIKKDAFYLYKANWSQEKFVHITSKRFVDRVDEMIEVKVYSNCGTVNLYVNGRQHGTESSEDGVFRFNQIALQEGWNEISATAAHAGAEYRDTAHFNKVNEGNRSYEAPEEKGGIVDNWFEMPDTSEVVIEELNITDEVYSTRCTMGTLMEHEATRAIVIAHLGDFTQHPMFPMGQGISFDALATIAPEIFTKKLLYLLNRDLTAIKKS